MDTDGQLASSSDSNMEYYSEVEEEDFPGSCIHISNYKSEYVLDDYRNLHWFYVAAVTKDSFKRKVCHVKSCKTSRTRIHACLYCIYFGCCDVKGRKLTHINLHARDKKHPLGMDTDSGHVFCFECNDYKYDFDFEKIRQEQNLKSCQRGIKACGTYKWEPSLDEINLLKWHEIVYDSNSDIRGFSNISTSICFMITIIQTLIHAPAFQDYLLSYKHKCKVKNETDYPTCFICEMTKILQECFSGNSVPYNLIDFLILIKDRLEEFATTDFHDAHEFFEPFLKKLYEDCEDIHNMFDFSFFTKYTCHKCRHVTNSDGQSDLCILLFSLGKPVSSLTDCFKSFLLENARKSCPECSEKSGKSEFVIKNLPLVLTFCFNIDQTSKFKFEFQEFLNISPENIKDGKNSWEVSGNPEYQYYLFSAVESLPGHYNVYIKKDKNKWFLCDSDSIEPVELEELKIKTVRMVFYHKMFL